ncbi:MAG: hypothetical protein KDI44_02225, partial [Thiothrix sp.]|nr:hypothetical protein [Thiothrix sp.]
MIRRIRLLLCVSGVLLGPLSLPAYSETGPENTPAPLPGDTYPPPVDPSPVSTPPVATGNGVDAVPVLLDDRNPHPRRFGFMLGDTLEQTLILRLPQGQYLNANTLPPPGRLNDWLDLTAFSLRRLPDQPSPAAGYSDERYEVTRRWQLFRQVDQPQRLRLPATTLLLRSGRYISLPGPEIGYSPMLPPGTVTPDSLRPPVLPQTPRPLSLSHQLWPLWGLAGCLLLWLWANGRLGFLGRTPGPYTRALRALRRLPDGAASDVQALQVLEQALNEQAGHPLFPDQLADFFSAYPHYRPLAEPLQALLEQGWKARFGADGTAFPDRMTVLELCRRFSEREQAVWCSHPSRYRYGIRHGPRWCSEFCV